MTDLIITHGGWKYDVTVTHFEAPYDTSMCGPGSAGYDDPGSPGEIGFEVNGIKPDGCGDLDLLCNNEELSELVWNEYTNESY